MTTSKLFLAPQRLSGCLFGAIHRDTRGADLQAADRLNHFPASALVAVSLITDGTLFLLPAGRDWHSGTLETGPVVVIWTGSAGSLTPEYSIYHYHAMV